MKFIIPKASLHKALARVQSVLERRSSMPILSHVLIEANEEIRLKATNLQVYYDIKLQGEIQEPGIVALPGRKLFNIIKESKSESFIFAKNDESTLTLTDGKTHYTIYLFDPESFPFFTYPEVKNCVSIKANTLIKCLTKSSICSAEEDDFPHLAGVFLHKGSVVGKVKFGGSDNFRLSLVEEELPELYNILPDKEIMIPTVAVDEILKFESGDYNLLFMLEGESVCIEKQDEIRLYLMVKFQPFIDYSDLYSMKIISNSTIKKASLQEALRRMSIFLEESIREVQMSFSQVGEGTLKLETSTESGRAEEVLGVVYNGGDFVIHIDPRQLLQALQIMESEYVELSFTGDRTPCIITGELDKGFVAAIMPYVEKEEE